MADACHRIERSTDGLDHTLQSMCVSKTNRKKRTHRVWVDVSMYPSACSIGIVTVRLFFERLQQVDANMVEPSPSYSWPLPRSPDMAKERESDGVRGAYGNWAGAHVAGTAEPPRETAGRCALAPVVGSGVRGVLKIDFEWRGLGGRPASGGDGSNVRSSSAAGSST